MRAFALALFFLLPLAGAAAAPGPLVLYTGVGSTGAPDLFVANPDGSDRVSLTGNVGLAENPAWSPDGTKVAFTTNRASNGTGPGDIYVVNVDGTGLHAVTSGATSWRMNPTWSPDGAQIAYLEQDSKNRVQSGDLWVVPSAGGTPTRLTTDGGIKSFASWQPHGSLVSYVRGNGTGWALWTVDVPSDTQHKVVDASPVVAQPSPWSPDGSELAFGDAKNRLALIAPDGSNFRELTSDAIAGSPSWSADGRRIAVAEIRIFASQYSGRFGPPSDEDVFTIDAASGAAHRLTGWFDSQALGPPSYGATWWPDGSRLFFHTTRTNELWQMNADGTCEQPYPGLGPVVGDPLWQPGATAGGHLDCVDLRLRADVLDGTLALSRPGTMRVTLENDGDLPATNVHLYVTIPSPATVQLSCPDGTAAPTCNVGTVPPGDSRTFLVSGWSPKDGTWIADATVVASQPNLTADDAHATFGFSVLPCTVVGTWGADVLNGTKGPDRICGLPGADRISGGPGDDYLNGGAGADTIIGGAGHDTILGKGGSDVIFARDGKRDWIDCGTERDIAVVDKLDHVSHCEKVLRS